MNNSLFSIIATRPTTIAASWCIIDSYTNRRTEKENCYQSGGTDTVKCF